MPFDPDADRAPEAAARAVAETAPDLSAVLLAECARLRHDNEDTRARERDALQRARGSPQLTFIQKRVFVDNLTILHDDDRAYVWLYEDDIVSLADDPAHHADPWAHNVEAENQLRRLWRGPDAGLVGSIRVCLFEGTDRMARVTRDLGAAELVTHLDLRVQKDGAVIEPVASSFPELRGLSCRAANVAALLAEGAPELRSLVVYLDHSPDVLDLALRAPKLRHLGLLHAAWSAADVAHLASHAIMNRVTSLDLFDVNHARTFPFAEVRARHEFAYLTRLYLPSHLVRPEVKATLDAPSVTFVTWDRRETIALDFEATGWGADAR